MNGKASTVLNPGSFVEIFLGLWLLNFETSNFLLKRSRLFFSVKAFLCFYDKKIVRGCLQLWKFSTWYQEIITAHILLLDTSLVRCSHSRDIELNTRGEIPYQRAPCIIHYLLIGDKMAEIVIQPQCKNSEKWPCTTIFNACLWLDRSVIGFHTNLFTYSDLSTRGRKANLRKLCKADTQSRVCITFEKFPNLPSV